MTRSKQILIDSKKLYPTEGFSKEALEARDLALNNFEAFIILCAPFQVMGSCHQHLCRWLQHTSSNYKLVLWPRDHGKSRYAAFWVAWQICRNPAVTCIYASATAAKAQDMLRFIKSILEGPQCRKYFPNLIKDQEGQRELWNAMEMNVDHPLRKKRGVVDATVLACGVGKTITGKHADKLILDDIVVNENNTETGREEVKRWFRFIASIMSTDSEMLVVGTRYHPDDLYDTIIQMRVEPEYDDDGNALGEAQPMFDVNQANVEQDGEFLWPRQQDKQGRWYGLNKQILNQKKAMYGSNMVDFYSQYYNDPNDTSIAPIGRDIFKYYNKEDLHYRGRWLIETNKDSEELDVYAALDPAFTTGIKSDFTAIAIGGMGPTGNRYLLHIERFKTDKPSEIYDRIVELYSKYRFKKLRIEAIAAQHALGMAMKEYIYERGVRIPIDFYRPPATDGGKAQRILNGLEPLYKSDSIYHYKGGNVQILEEELISMHSRHDDMKDVWFMCNDLMELPLYRRRKRTNNIVKFHPKFGGVM